MWVPLTMGFGVGILTGLMGVGGGFINFPLLIYVLGVPTHVAIGTSAVQVLLASGYGALRHAGQRHVELPLVLLLTAGSVLGVQVGVRMAKRFKGVRIRPPVRGRPAPGHRDDRLGRQPATARGIENRMRAEPSRHPIGCHAVSIVASPGEVVQRLML